MNDVLQNQRMNKIIYKNGKICILEDLVLILQFFNTNLVPIRTPQCPNAPLKLPSLEESDLVYLPY